MRGRGLKQKSGKCQVRARLAQGLLFIVECAGQTGLALSEEGTVMPETILEVQNISKCYGGRGKHRKGHDENTTKALDSVSFSVEAGEFVAIMGPSGSGKSTLLNCLATIDAPTEGSIAVGGKSVVGLSSAEVAKFRREELGFIFQDSNMLDTLTIRENIALALTLTNAPAREVKPQVEGLAARLGIESTLDRYPYEVSGGQRQRAAAARAVITKPRLILADEPTGALDSKATKDLLANLVFLNKGGATIVMVTHDSNVASYCGRILFIRDGKLWGEMLRGSNDRKTFLARILAATTRMEEGDSYDA